MIDLKKEMIAVSFDDNEEANKFLNMCDKDGITWANGSKITSNTACVSTKCVSISQYNNGITYGNAVVWEDYGYKIVKFSDLFKDDIRIESFVSGNCVICVKKINGKVVNKGVAHCHPSDVFDFEYGEKIARKRMNGKDPFKKKTKVVRMDDYNVGDTVVLKKKLINDFAEVEIGVPKNVVLTKTLDKQFGQLYCFKDVRGILRGAVISDIKGKVIV